VTLLTCLDACLAQFITVTGSKLNEFMPGLRKTCLKVACAVATRQVIGTAKDVQRLAFGSFCLGFVSSGLATAAALQPPGKNEDEWLAMTDAVRRCHGDTTYAGAPIPASQSMIIMLLTTGSNIEQLRQAALEAALESVEA
jgi:hypothetical protein